MNGQEHYLAAEKLLALAEAAPQRIIAGIDQSVDDLEFFSQSSVTVGALTVDYRDDILIAAQVHATLAQAAATGCVGNEAVRRAWLDITATP